MSQYWAEVCVGKVILYSEVFGESELFRLRPKLM